MNIWIPCLGYHHLKCGSHFNFRYPRVWKIYFKHLWNYHVIKKYHRKSYAIRTDYGEFDNRGQK